MFRFLATQLQQIRTGGVATALRKAGRLLFLCVLAPAVLCVRAFRPIRLIRFGTIYSRRMGHAAIEPELHLLVRDAGLYPPNSVDLFHFESPSVNRQLQRMWSRAKGFHVWQLSYYLELANRLVPGGEAHRVPNLWAIWPTPQPAVRAHPHLPRLLLRSPSRLAFSDEEEQRGRIALRKMGLPDGSPFVCFNARDAGFLDATQPTKDWRYHDYRDGSIQHYLPAVDEMTRRGHWGFRMGAFMKDSLQSRNPKIVDYAMCCRSDFMDVFLTAKCQFLINDSSGLMSVAMVFRRPVVLVNIIPMGVGFAPYNFEDRGLFIPKRLRRRKDGRFLTFREFLGSEIGVYSRSDEYERAGIEVVENTPEEILAVTVEMADRLEHTWQAHAEDDELQERYLQILSDCGMKDLAPCRIGAAFLREHRALLQ